MLAASCFEICISKLGTVVANYHLLVYPQSLCWDLLVMLQDLECNVLCKIAHMGEAALVQTTH